MDDEPKVYNGPDRRLNDPNASVPRTRPRRGGARAESDDYNHPMKSAIGGMCAVGSCRAGSTVMCQDEDCLEYNRPLCVTHAAEHASLVAIAAVSKGLPDDLAVELPKNLESFSGQLGVRPANYGPLAWTQHVVSNMRDAASLLTETLDWFERQE